MAERAIEPRAAGDDRDYVFETLYAAHHRAVLAYCARRASRSDAWDAASEVFLVAWRRLDDVPRPDEARAWLLGVAYKVLANQRRGTHRRRRLTAKATATATDVAWPADEQLLRNEEESAVVAALARLSPTDREILQLSLWEELAPVDIAAILGITRTAVDQRYSRAKKRLAREMDRVTVTTRSATQQDKGGAP